MVGRSLKQIVWARLRRDKVAMVCLFILILYGVVAVLGPFLGKTFFGLDPYAFDRAAISDLGGRPADGWGISGKHLAGVEWGTGRDILSQLVCGLQRSIIVATSATFLTVTFGTIIGIVSGYIGGWVDQIIGRLTDLTLAFP